MRKKSRRLCIIQVALLALAAARSRATDVGMPLHSEATGGGGNLEFYFEQFRRDIRQDFVDGPDTAKQKESRIIERINVHAGSRAAVYAEIGATRSDQAEHVVPLFGAGLAVRLHESPALGVNAFASGTYIHGIEYRQSGYVTYSEPGYVWAEYPDLDQRESYFEYNAGLTLSRLFRPNAKVICTPYAGLMLSGIDGTEEYHLTYHVNARTETRSGNLRGDGAISPFGGLGLTFSKDWCIRIEGRFVNQTSLSAGLVYFF
jgi:hypothetical protein